MVIYLSGHEQEDLGPAPYGKEGFDFSIIWVILLLLVAAVAVGTSYIGYDLTHGVPLIGDIIVVVAVIILGFTLTFFFMNMWTKSGSKRFAVLMAIASIALVVIILMVIASSSL